MVQAIWSSWGWRCGLEPGYDEEPDDEFFWWRGMGLQVYVYPWGTLDLG
jgi:hypothetical protein